MGPSTRDATSPIGSVSPVRVALGQVDCVSGDIEANLRTVADALAAAGAAGADLVVFPELAVTGYAGIAPGADCCIAAADDRLAGLAAGWPHLDSVIGFQEDAGLHTYNSTAYLAGGAVRHLQRKLYLPTYDVFEERKHFSPGQALRAFNTGHGRMAMLICNDAWQAVLPFIAVHDGAEVLVVPANSAVLGSPELDTQKYWRELLIHVGRMSQAWVVFVNRVGTEQGLRFWGGSCVVDPSGTVVAQASEFAEALLVVDIDVSAARRRRRRVPLLKEGRLGLLLRELERLSREGGDA